MDFVKLDLLPIIVGTDPAKAIQATPGDRHEAVSERFRSGTVVSQPYEGGPEVQADTLACVHCHFTWVPVRGSGRRRGFCMRCSGVTCGRPSCERTGCVPGGQQRILENIEHGRPAHHVPITVSVPAAQGGILLG